VDGLENPTECFGNICGWLVRHGYADDEIRAVLGGNIYRVLQSIWVAPGPAGPSVRDTASPIGRTLPSSPNGPIVIMGLVALGRHQTHDHEGMVGAEGRRCRLRS
jgi:hypothetical protein